MMIWFRIIISLLILLFGIGTTWFLSYKWIIVGTVLFSIPLLSQASKNIMVKSFAIWFGIFLIFQSLLSPVLTGKQLKTLKPNMDMTWDVRGGIPGIEGLQHITTDLKGFRVTKSVNYTQKKAYRIFTIGGSTTEQLLLDDHRTWTHLLQQNIENNSNLDVEVINCGVSGTRARHNYHSLLEISEYMPDLVIFHLGINDMYYHILSNFNPFISLSFDRTIIGKKIKILFNKLTGPKVTSASQTGPKVTLGEDYSRKRNSLARSKEKRFRPDRVSKDYRYYLDKIIKHCKERNIKCVFMTQPSGYQEGASEEFKKGFWMTPPEAKYTLDFDSMIFTSKVYNKYLVELAQMNKIPVLDLTEKIPASYDYMYDDCHFNSNGVKKVSTLLTQFLLPVVAPNQIN